MNTDKILSLLSGSDSKNPMPLRVLKDKAGMAMGPLIELIEEMYSARSINKCIVSKHGVTQVMVWPTGVPEKVSFGAFSISPPKAPARLENSQEYSMEKEKSKTQIMLDLIAEKGSATTAELAQATGTSSVKAFLDRHVKNGSIGYDQASKTYFSGRMIAQTETENLVAEQKQDVTPDHVPDVKEMVIPAPIPVARSRFRLARTSDGTLMLFGLGSEPIELDQDQTALLVKFVTSEVLLHG